MTHVATPTFNVLSLCSGFGGLDLGISLAEPSARCVAYVEGEAYAAAVLVRRMEEETLDEAPVWSDVRTFDGKPWRGVVDCISGGYPCQPFSLAGRRQGEDDPRHLWPSIRRIITEIGPEWCFFENVSGHLSMGFETVADDLCGMGYEVAAGLFTASEVGATHQRERLFIMAHSERPERRSGDEALGRASEGIDGEGQEASTVGVLRSMLGYPASDGRREGRAEHEFRGGRDAATDAGGSLAAANGFRYTERPVFPPGPGDLYTWLRVLEAHPTFEPAVRRVAHGLANRVDRLRGCGNGVVPLAAAHAWLTLRDALSR